MGLAKIPPETARLQSTTVSAVREDWMVEMEGTKLPTPHAVTRTKSLAPESGTEFFDAESRCEGEDSHKAVQETCEQ